MRMHLPGQSLARNRQTGLRLKQQLAISPGVRALNHSLKKAAGPDFWADLEKASTPSGGASCSRDKVAAGFDHWPAASLQLWKLSRNANAEDQREGRGAGPAQRRVSEGSSSQGEGGLKFRGVWPSSITRP